MKIKALPYIGEFLGTFLLVLSILMSNGNAVFAGLTLTFVIWFGGSLSGAHVNPALSIVKYLTGKLTSFELSGYIASQIAGAITSAYVMKIFA